MGYIIVYLVVILLWELISISFFAHRNKAIDNIFIYSESFGLILVHYLNLVLSLIGQEELLGPRIGTFYLDA